MARSSVAGVSRRDAMASSIANERLVRSGSVVIWLSADMPATISNRWYCSFLSRARHARLTEYVLVSVGLVAATALTTWPHARVFTSHVISHIDPLLSMWRMAWFAHAVGHREPLLHANIFYPEPFTYLLSDATFLQGALAAPAIWSGVALPIVYNAMLLLGIVSSGVAIYGWRRVWASGARRRSSPRPCFRWHRTGWSTCGTSNCSGAPSPSSRFGCSLSPAHAPRSDPRSDPRACDVAAVSVQRVLRLFLLPILLALTIASVGRLPDWRSTCRIGVVAAVLCAALTLPIARLYMHQGMRVGERPIGDIAMYSATPVNYLASPEQNTIYGRTANWLGAGERRLFPGGAALALAAVGLFSVRRRDCGSRADCHAAFVRAVIGAQRVCCIRGFWSGGRRSMDSARRQDLRSTSWLASPCLPPSAANAS